MIDLILYFLIYVYTATYFKLWQYIGFLLLLPKLVFDTSFLLLNFSSVQEIYIFVPPNSIAVSIRLTWCVRRSKVVYGVGAKEQENPIY